MLEPYSFSEMNLNWRRILSSLLVVVAGGAVGLTLGGLFSWVAGVLVCFLGGLYGFVWLGYHQKEDVLLHTTIAGGVFALIGGLPIFFLFLVMGALSSDSEEAQLLSLLLIGVVVLAAIVGGGIGLIVRKAGWPILLRDFTQR